MENKICSKCGEAKPLSAFHRLSSNPDGKRPDCKKCHMKMKQAQKDKADPIEWCAWELAHGILKRLIYDAHKPKNKCYAGIECRLGSSRKEITETLLSNFRTDIKALLYAGKTPSVDRIRSEGHYELGNIRIIDLRDNYLEGQKRAVEVTSRPIQATYPDGRSEQFPSVSEASRSLGIKRDTIYAHLDKGTTTRYGLSFRPIR